MKKNLKSIAFYALFVAITVAVIFFVMNSMKDKAKTTSDLVDLFESGQVSSYVWDQYSDNLTVKDHAGNKLTFPGISQPVYVSQILPVVEKINAAVEAQLQYQAALEQDNKDKEAFEKGELKEEPTEPQ